VRTAPFTDARTEARQLLDKVSKTPAFKSDEALWAHLRRRHPSLTSEYDAAPDVTAVLVDVKNRDLDFSIDVTFGFSRDLIEAQLAWFLREFHGIARPRHLLDLGCEMGVLTCVYGALFPDAEILGVDRCAPAIARGVELAERLSLKNVGFLHGDFASDLAGLVGPASFDFVASSRAIGNQAVDAKLLDVSGDEALFTDTALRRGPGWERVQAILNGIAGIMEPGGTLVALDRWQRPSAVMWFTEALVKAGFAPDWGASFMLRCTEMRNYQRLPIVVGHKGGVVQFDPALAALAFADYEQFGADAKMGPLTGAAAESLVRAVRLDEPLYAAEIAYATSGVQRVELWRCGGLVLSWSSTTRGQRQVVLRSMAMLDDTHDEVIQQLAAAEGAGYRVNEGVSPILKTILSA
jgi:SAM-dependent methyltransferase